MTHIPALSFFWTWRHPRGLKTQSFFSSSWSRTKHSALAPDPLQCQTTSRTKPRAGEVFLGTLAEGTSANKVQQGFCWWLEKTYWMSFGMFISVKQWASFLTFNMPDYWFNTNGNWSKDCRLFGWRTLKPFPASVSMQNISKQYSYEWRAYQLII